MIYDIACQVYYNIFYVLLLARSERQKKLPGASTVVTIKMRLYIFTPHCHLKVKDIKNNIQG